VVLAVMRFLVSQGFKDYLILRELKLLDKLINELIAKPKERRKRSIIK